MNFTFKNASIVSVNSGTIVLNVSGKTRTFVDAKLVSAVDGNIVLDLSECFIANGKYMVLDLDLIFIAEVLIEEEDAIIYHVSQRNFNNLDYNDFWNSFHICRNATPEEIQELNDQLAAEGKCWNPDTMQIEKLRWKPKKGELYFSILLRQIPEIAHYLWTGDSLDMNFYKMGNCFKTEEEVLAKLEQIKKLLLEV